MTDLLREQISALTDGELSVEESELLLKRLQADPALKKSWESYHLTGDAMRQGLASVHDRNLSKRVKAAIETEAQLPKRFVDRKFVPLVRPVAGFAIAATVAIVAIMGIQPQQIAPPSEVVPTNVAASASDVDYRLAQPVNWNLTQQDEVKEKLNSYLINHNMNSKSRAFQGMNPYVHIAAYDNREAEQDDETEIDDSPETSEQ